MTLRKEGIYVSDSGRRFVGSLDRWIFRDAYQQFCDPSADPVRNHLSYHELRHGTKGIVGLLSTAEEHCVGRDAPRPRY